MFCFLGSHVFLRGIEIEVSQLLEIKCRVFKSDRNACVRYPCYYVCTEKSEGILM